MPDAAPDLIRRQRALQKTMAKYRGKPFDWGKADCIVMLRSHLVAMAHKRLPKLPRYTDAISAKRSLKSLGFDSVAALLDGILPRVTTARALLGDVVLLEGTAGLNAVTLATGGGKVAGWHEDAPGMVVMDPRQIVGTWRA